MGKRRLGKKGIFPHCVLDCVLLHDSVFEDSEKSSWIVAG